jgi:cytochrome c biogenesis protein CcmG/thiol:disulfide interchange protein DsbE
MSEPERANTAPPSKPAIPWLRLAPVVVFLGLVGVFAVMLYQGEPNRLPSALIGKPAPALTLAPLEGLTTSAGAVPGVTPASLSTGTPTVVNFWASWCPPCIEEHPVLVALVRQHGARLIGINYKDQAANARRFLGRHGNPFAAVGVDPDGKAAIEWGVAGMPETFVLDGQGRIVAKHVGAISETILRRIILPAIERAERAPRT